MNDVYIPVKVHLWQQHGFWWASLDCGCESACYCDDSGLGQIEANGPTPEMAVERLVQKLREEGRTE